MTEGKGGVYCLQAHSLYDCSGGGRVNLKAEVRNYHVSEGTEAQGPSPTFSQAHIAGVWARMGVERA